jgi:hypothetical protein
MVDRFTPKSAQRAAEWLDSTTKPTWMKSHPVAVSLVALLLAHNAEEHPWVVTHNTLAQSCACSLTHIKDEIEELQAKGWLTKTGVKGEVKGFSLIDAADGYSEHLGNPETQITPDAKEFASWYRSAQKQHWSEVSKRNKREASKKTLEQGRQLNAARILQHAGSLARAKAMAQFAIDSPKYRKRALQTPYNLQCVLNQKNFIDDFESGVPMKPESTSGCPPLPQSVIDRAREQGKMKQLDTLQEYRERMFKSRRGGPDVDDEGVLVLVRLQQLAQSLNVTSDEWADTVATVMRRAE